jgi:hypothetical protein
MAVALTPNAVTEIVNRFQEEKQSGRINNIPFQPVVQITGAAVVSLMPATTSRHVGVWVATNLLIYAICFSSSLKLLEAGADHVNIRLLQNVVLSRRTAKSDSKSCWVMVISW